MVKPIFMVPMDPPVVVARGGCVGIANAIFRFFLLAGLLLGVSAYIINLSSLIKGLII